MANSKFMRLACVSAAVLTAGGIGEAQAGGFGIREQSTYFLGDEFAGAAAGGDISSMFWNPAATAALPGFNSSSNYTGAFASAKETATGGAFYGSGPNSTDVGTDSLIPASYMTYQLSDRFYAGLGLNAPFGFITKPDNGAWAGSPLATTSKVFSIDANPTVAYKITPTITIGAGVQIEYFEIKLDHGSFDIAGVPYTPSRAYKADDVGVGATAGILWQPAPGTSVGLGYRSAVSLNLSGLYSVGGSLTTGSPFATVANSNLTLPDEVTFSVRQAVSPTLTLLGTVEWQNWSSIGNVTAQSSVCPNGVCETLNLNYQDGWFFSVGAEYAWSPVLTLRTGVAWERSPIDDANRDILLPDSDRVHVGVGASYKWSDKITINAAYSHIFYEDDAAFCMANPALNGGSSHCNAATPAGAVLLKGTADVEVDLVSVGVNYRISGPAPLEPWK
jgi:long-chain fatty acid transport protein